MSEGSVLLEEVSRRQTETSTSGRVFTTASTSTRRVASRSVQRRARPSVLRRHFFTILTTHPRCVRRNKSPGDASVRHVRLHSGLVDGC